MQEEDNEGIVCLLPNWLLFVEFKKNEGLISENEIHTFFNSERKNKHLYHNF